MEKEDARNQGAKKARCADKKREERLHAGRALAQALQRAGGVWERRGFTPRCKQAVPQRASCAKARLPGRYNL